MLGIVISVPFTHSCLLTSLVQIMEHLENRGEEERDVALLVWFGSLSDLICLDRLQKNRHLGSGELEIAVCLCDRARHRTKPSTSSVLSTYSVPQGWHCMAVNIHGVC